MKSIEWERAIQVVDDLIKFSALTDNKESRLQQIWAISRLDLSFESRHEVNFLTARFTGQIR